MTLRKIVLSCVGSALLAGAALGTASAQTNFADVSSSVFNFNSTTGALTSGPSSVVFTFDVPSTGGFVPTGSTFPATFKFAGTLGTTSTLNGVIVTTFTNVTESVTAGGHNLVSTVSPQTATFSAVNGSQTGSLFLSGNNIFSSEYFKASGIETDSISFKTTSGTFNTSGGKLSSFQAKTLSNTFSATSVPEASTMLGLGGLVLGGGLLGLRRRK